jgi:LysM repeat protein
MNLYNKFFLVLLLILPFISKGQIDPQINNTFSQTGLGELLPVRTLRNLGMGGVGIAVPGNQYLNFQNPALLSRNRMVTHTVLHNETVSSIAKTYSVSEEEVRDLNDISEEVKEGQVIKIPVRKYTLWESAIRFTIQKTKSTTSLLDYTDRSINFQYFAFSFPLSQRISVAGGLAPYSQAGGSTSIAGPPLLSGLKKYTNHKLDGGLNQAFLSGGYDINRNFSVGIQAGYIFGRFTEENFLLVDSGNTRFSNNGTVNFKGYSGLSFKPGVFYRAQINKAGADSTIFVNFGFTADLNTKLFTLSKTSEQVRTQYNAITGETLESSTTSHTAIPPTWNFGISVNHSEYWLIGTEFSFTPAGSLYTSNSYKLSLGGEWKYFGRRDKGSVKAPTLRAGVSYGALPYLFDGKQVNEYSLSLGGSVPMGKINNADKHQPLSKINLAVIGGITGEENLSAGRQMFLKAQAGILINDKWFRKRRIN